MHHRTITLGLVISLAGCGAPVSTPTAATSAPRSASARDPLGDPLGDPVPAPAPTESDAEPEIAEPSRPWRVALAANEGVWSMEALDDERVVLLSHLDSAQEGYDPMGTTFAIEVRDRRFALVWRVLSDENVMSVHASFDGTRVLVLGVETSRVLSAADGTELLSLPGYAIDGTLDDRGRIVRALRSREGNHVEVAGPDGVVIARLPVLGSAPTTIHVMHTDGECEAIDTEGAAHVTSLASAHGLVAIGASDGSIRLHRDGDPPERERRLSRRDVRQHRGSAVSAVSLFFRGADELVAVYGDGSIVRWGARDGARRGLVSGACTPSELARIAVIPGLPGDVEECGGTTRAALSGEHVVVVGASGARVRTLAGRAITGFSTLHANGIVARGDEIWLAGTTSVVERWSLDGTFRGVHRVGTGWANVVALSADHVAIVGAGEGMPHGQETEGPRPIAIWRLREGTRVRGMDDVRTDVRFVGSRIVAGLADGSVAVRELADGRELLRVRAGPMPDVGLPALSVSIVPADGLALIVGERMHLVGASEIRELGPAPPRPDVGVITEQHASADGSLMARVIFEPGPFTFALEVWSLGPSPALRFRRDRVGEHASLRADGAQVIVSSRGEEHARLFEASTGTELELPLVDAAWAGFDAQARACVQSRALEARLSCLENGAFVTAGPQLLSPTGTSTLGARTVVFSLGSGAYVLGEHGDVLAHVGGVEGNGFAITTPEGLVRASEGEHDELFVRQGRQTRVVSASEALGDRAWTALVGR